MKACKKCGITKPLTEYHYHPSSKDDHQHVCKVCRSEDAKAYFQKLREKNADVVRDGLPRQCKSCGEVKPCEQFDFSRASLGGFKLRCKECEAARHRKVKYGISREQQIEMLEKQGHKCAICGKSIADKKYHIDHCHTTNTVRGALCSLCNRGLGMFRERKESLLAAIDYLNKASLTPNGPVF